MPPKRLLDSKSFKLVVSEELPDPDVRYMIVSHRWARQEEQEITHEDLENDVFMQQNLEKFQNPENIDQLKEPGLAKVAWACKFAREAGISYVWIDTCCIKKNHSRELDASISSMYSWYQGAYCCVAFLLDVDKDAQDHDAYAFQKSEWFTRGWTLQEMLAPRKEDMWFYDKNFAFMGTKGDLIGEIHEATGIEPQYLDGDFSDACIAVKMSWAAHRKTTYLDDAAYCMVGIFDVPFQVSPPNSEREGAFLRLQKVLITHFPHDESIYAWRLPESCSDKSIQHYGLLAPWITCFKYSSNLTIDYPNAKFLQRRSPHYPHADGVQFQLPSEYKYALVPTMTKSDNEPGYGQYTNIGLNCWEIGREHEGRIRISLVQVENKYRGVQWRRTNIRSIVLEHNSKPPKVRKWDHPQKQNSSAEEIYVPNVIHSEERKIAAHLASIRPEPHKPHEVRKWQSAMQYGEKHSRRPRAGCGFGTKMILLLRRV